MTEHTSRRDFMRTVGATAAVSVAGTTMLSSVARAAPPFFKLYFMIPNNQPARMIWGTLAAQQMVKIGIDVVSSYVPFTVIIPRRTTGAGKPHAEGGWDAYLERYYYSSIAPLPNTLFHSKAVPPNGPNFYYINDPVLDAAMDEYASTADDARRMAAIRAFEKRWYETEPMTILFYPEDVIAINPKMKGFTATTFNPVFYPDPENWIIDGSTDAAFASWAPPSTLVPMYSTGYNESNIFGPVYDRLLTYDSWNSKKLVPSLAESWTTSPDGKKWVIKLRQGVKWHSGEEFTAEDVKFTWDVILDKAYATQNQAGFAKVFGGAGAYKVTGKHEITVELPEYTILFKELVMGATAIMPMHAYKDIKPEAMRGHVISTWLGTFTTKTSDGKSYTSRGGIGTGPWIAQGFDPARKAYKFTKNPNYWRKTPGNVQTFYVVNIQGTDSVLSALKAGEIDAHDPMYDVGTLAGTIDPKWGKVLTFDSFKWQHICYNLKHPVFGTGVETPLGKQDPSRAAEAAAYIRKAISHAMPREQIVKEIAAGYGKEGTVPMPFSAPEYDHDLLKPIAYDLDLAKSFMEKAGYKF
ncbi:MAG: twin-arginine translocation signal domain-containing protein [Alphaproteobacteria bacterium]|nr:twin-arginine translocation signal domain-containing protein [Alphaproteobacteria bacterium]